jgi:hypothetical protein
MSYGYQTNNYAAGDYAYTGGNYQAGGIIGNVLKGIGKVVGAVTGLSPGVAIAKRALGAITGRPAAPMIAPPSFGPDVGTSMVLVGGGQAGIPLRPELMGLCNVKGRRLNKSTYVTRGGGTSQWPQQILIHPKGTECVKSRRMNVANVRALRRSIRRATGFAKLARRVMTFVDARAPKGRARFKKKR